MIGFILNVLNFIRSLDTPSPPKRKRYAEATDAFMGIWTPAAIARPEMIPPWEAISLPDNLARPTNEVDWKRDGF